MADFRLVILSMFKDIKNFRVKAYSKRKYLRIMKSKYSTPG